MEGDRQTDWKGSTYLNRSSSKSYFASDMKRSQSRPNLIAKDKSSLAKLGDGLTRQPSGVGSGKTSGRLEEALMRHNSCSFISGNKKAKLRPAAGKTQILAEVDEKESISNRIANNISNKPESSYQAKKKALARKRPSNMLFSKLGLVTQGQNSKIGNRISSRKQSQAGISYKNKQNDYLMSRLSPKSQASGGAEPYFRFDFLDYSEAGNIANQSGSKERLEGKSIIYDELASSNFRKAFGGRNRLQQKDQLDQSTSSSSIANIDKNQDLIQSKMTDTLARLSELLKSKQKADRDQLRRFKAIVSENAILRQKLKAIEGQMH